ncbi:MAG: hypothetical protein ACREQX_13095 [Candidatus Binataceae bacterium]
MTTNSTLTRVEREQSNEHMRELRWLLIVGVCVLLVGCGGGGSSSSTSASSSAIPSNIGTVEVAMLANSGQPFQDITLNVLAVRLNPSTDPNVAESDKNWQNISVPPANGLIASGASTMIIGTNPGTSASKSAQFGQVVQSLDFTQLQGMAQLFNAGAIKPQTYTQVELLLSPTNPGSITPICGADPAAEGCIPYPLRLASGISSIRTTLPGGLTVVKRELVPLVLEVNLNLPSPAVAPFTITPTITIVPNANNNNPDLAAVNGKVTTSGAVSTSGKNLPMVNAVLSTTGQFVAGVAVSKDGSYSLGLPATPSGTSYDLYTSSSGRSFAINSAQVVTAGQSPTVNFTPAAHGTQALKGTVADACTGLAIQGATLELLASPDSPSLACGTTYPVPAGCVVVANASTNVNGTYPLPTISGSGIAFNTIPTDLTYALRITASGYDPTVASVTFKKGQFSCSIIGPTGSIATPTSKTKGQCIVSLDRAQLTGTVSLATPNAGPNLGVIVTAEDQGTNHLENIGPVTIPSGASSTPFNMLVPTSTYLAATNPGAPGLDLFASVKDLFPGTLESNTGHTIAVVVATPSAANCQTATAVTTLGPMACVGHGSFNGTVTSFDSGTTVVMFKNNVQLVTTPVGSANSANPGGFGLCAPADTYTVAHYENGVPVPGAMVTDTLAPPLSIGTPCNSICQPPTAGTCFMCTAATAVTLP